MAKQRISANQVSVGSSGVAGAVLSSNGSSSYWANSVVVGTGNTTSAPLKFLSNTTLTTANAGVIEYTGTAFYATPVGTQRGVVPGQQMFVLQTPWVGNATSTTAQGIFGTGVSGNGIGVTLSSNTTYAFEIDAVLIKSAGTTSHTISIAFGGNATLTSIFWDARVNDWNAGFNTLGTSTNQQAVAANTSATTVTTGALTSASTSWNGLIKGIVAVNAGGTFIPQYVLSAAPGGAYTTQTGGYMLVYPISTGSANISIGTWA